MSSQDTPTKRTIGNLARAESAKRGRVRRAGPFIPIAPPGGTGIAPTPLAPSGSQTNLSSSTTTSDVRSYDFYSRTDGRLGSHRQDTRITLAVTDILRADSADDDSTDTHLFDNSFDTSDLNDTARVNKPEPLRPRPEQREAVSISSGKAVSENSVHLRRNVDSTDY